MQLEIPVTYIDYFINIDKIDIEYSGQPIFITNEHMTIHLKEVYKQTSTAGYTHRFRHQTPTNKGVCYTGSDSVTSLYVQKGI